MVAEETVIRNAGTLRLASDDADKFRSMFSARSHIMKDDKASIEEKKIDCEKLYADILANTSTEKTAKGAAGSLEAAKAIFRLSDAVLELLDQVRLH